MQAHEPGHLLDLALREPQPFKRRHRHRRSNVLMTGEGAVRRGRTRLAHIVEEGGQPEDEIRLGVLNRFQRVAVNVVRVIAALLDALARGDLGQNALEQPALVEQLDRPARPLGLQDLAQLVRDSLGGDDRLHEPALHLSHGRRDLRRRFEAELGREADGTKHAQRVVAERLRRVDRRAEHLRGEVGATAAQRVADVAVEIHQQRVDREIAPLDVLLERGRADDWLA